MTEDIKGVLYAFFHVWGLGYSSPIVLLVKKWIINLLKCENMKKLLIILLAAVLVGNTVNAQSDKELRKKREAISKMSKSEIER